MNEKIWNVWNSLEEWEHFPVRTIAQQLGVSEFEVAAVVYPPSEYGEWVSQDEPVVYDYYVISDGYLRPDVHRYKRILNKAGRDPHESARAVLYAQQFGLAALSTEGCVFFGSPTCGIEECLVPQHQTLVKE